jgi:HK97 family phage portal protein
MSLWTRILAAFTGSRVQQPGEPRIFVAQRQAGVVVSEDTALTNAAVWACVRVIAETVAALPWHVYRKTAGGREPMDGSAVHWLLNNQPNPEQTAFAFREALMAHVLTWGNGYAEIERDMAARPAALWIITPDRVTPKRDDAGVLSYEAVDDAGQRTTIAAANMLHLHGLGFDGLVGYSPVRMAARSIGLGIAQDTFSAAFYGNGTALGGMVEVPATMQPEQIATMENYINDKHRGPDKAFKVRIVANGMKYHQVGMPLTDAQFIESRRFSVTEVARWYRVPPHKVADLERSTNNNIEHQSIEFVTDTIVPWVARLEQEVNVKLFGARSQGAVYTKLMINALMRGDAKSRAEFYRTMTQIGAMSINEVRGFEEMNGIGDAGDEHLVQLNQTTLEKLVEDPPAPGAAKPAAAADPPAEPTAEPETEPETEPSASTSNVIRMQALDFWRQQQDKEHQG